MQSINDQCLNAVPGCALAAACTLLAGLVGPVSTHQKIPPGEDAGVESSAVGI